MQYKGYTYAMAKWKRCEKGKLFRAINTTIPLSEKVGKEIVKRDDKRAKGKKLESEIGYFGMGQRKEVPNQRRSRCDNRTEEGIKMLRLQA